MASSASRAMPFPLMKASGRASLVNLASIMGHRGMRTLAAYGATKGAISALTRGLAVEYATFGIRVNSLAPGFIETALTERVLRIEAFSKALLEQTPLRRFGHLGGRGAGGAVLRFGRKRLHHRRRARRRRRHAGGALGSLSPFAPLLGRGDTHSGAGDGFGDEMVDDADQRFVFTRAAGD